MKELEETLITVDSKYVETYDNTAGEMSKIIEIEAPSKKQGWKLKKGTLPFIAPIPQETLTTDGSDSEPETLNLSNDLVEAPRLPQQVATGGSAKNETRQRVMVYDTDSGEQRLPDAVDYTADTIDYTDVNSPSSSSTDLNVYYAQILDSNIQLRYVPQNRRDHTPLWDTDHFEQLAKDITKRDTNITPVQREKTIFGKERFEVWIDTETDLSNWYEAPAPFFKLWLQGVMKEI